MTVKEFIEQLQKFPDNMEIRVMDYDREMGDMYFTEPELKTGKVWKQGEHAGDKSTMNCYFTGNLFKSPLVETDCIIIQ